MTINSETCYTLSDFQLKTGLKRDAMRTARQNGLRVIRVHNRAFLIGRDWLSYLDKLDRTKEETPERS